MAFNNGIGSKGCRQTDQFDFFRLVFAAVLAARIAASLAAYLATLLSHGLADGRSNPFDQVMSGSERL